MELQAKRGSGWHVLSRVKTTSRGDYSLRFPTSFYARNVLRVFVPKSHGETAAASRSFAITVKPAYTLLGSPSAYAFEETTGTKRTPARWNPCKPIDYRIRGTEQFPGANKMIESAVSEIGRATGITFRYAGTTTLHANAKRDIHGTNDIIIEWSNETAGGELSGSAGYTTPVWVRRGDVTEIVSAGIKLNTAIISDPSDYDGFPTWDDLNYMTYLTTLHEMGHAMGLDHVNDSQQIMYPVGGPELASRLGAGDLAGLARLGVTAGCSPSGLR